MSKAKKVDRQNQDQSLNKQNRQNQDAPIQDVDDVAIETGRLNTNRQGSNEIRTPEEDVTMNNPDRSGNVRDLVDEEEFNDDDVNPNRNVRNQESNQTTDK